MSESQGSGSAVAVVPRTPISEHQERITSVLDGLAAEAIRSDEIGKLTDESVRLINESGVMRLLGNTDFGGDEAHPAEFMQACNKIGAVAPSAAWVSGVVGVHPFEFGQYDPRLQEEIWGPNGSRPNVWTASPYAPMGVGRKVDGGYIVSGHWSFSTGCDHSDWLILGGFAADEQGEKLTPPSIKHFVLPKADAEILHDSWDVMGLAGTGSKDVVLKDVFIPDYRAIDGKKIRAGEYAREFVPEKDLYKIPMGVMFCFAVQSGTLGIAQGVIDRFEEYTATRTNIMRGAAAESPFQTRALGMVKADIKASKAHVLNEITEYYDYVKRGGEVKPEHTVELSSFGVRATKRAFFAAFEAYQRAGGNAARFDNPVQRFWRDLNVGMGHGCNVDEPAYQDAGLVAVGHEPVNQRG